MILQQRNSCDFLNGTRRLALGLSILCSAAAWAQQYTISTVAGNATQGFSGDSGAATAAQLGLPGGVAVAPSGDIYIADGANHRVRVVSNGNISTFAGNGTAGYKGDGAAATSANLSNPLSVAVDSSGAVYVADTANHVIRKVTSGNITTFAGVNSIGYSGDGAEATKAQLNTPTSIALDSSGNLYIADAGNNVIRKVTGGTISTILGSGLTPILLNHPNAITVDAAGTVFIADTQDRRVVKYVPSTGTATVIAGTGAPAFGGDNGPANKAALYDPMGIAVDSSGNVYIADTFNNRIRKVFADGSITTIAGTGSGYYSGDGGPATQATLFFPHGIALDGKGNVYFADTANNTVRLLKLTAPVLFNPSVANAASFAPQISPGALATLFGANFASGNASASAPLPASLAGVSVSVNGKAAPILFVGPGQVNFQVPWGASVGSANVAVSVGGVSSNSVTVPVVTAGPGLFVYGSNRAVVQNSDFTLNTSSNPVKAGGTIIAYLTGSGPVSPPVLDGAATPSSPLVQVASPYSATIGSATAQVSFAGLTPTFVGLLQMNIVVPATLATGDYPLSVTINGEKSNAATISVQQ